MVYGEPYFRRTTSNPSNHTSTPSIFIKNLFNKIGRGRQCAMGTPGSVPEVRFRLGCADSGAPSKNTRLLVGAGVRWRLLNLRDKNRVDRGRGGQRCDAGHVVQLNQQVTSCVFLEHIGVAAELEGNRLCINGIHGASHCQPFS